MKSLTVCLVSDDFDPAITGVGVHVQAITEALIEAGHRVIVCTTRRPEQLPHEVWKGASVYRFFSFSTQGFYQAIPRYATLYKVLTKEKPDIIHCHYHSVLMYKILKVGKKLQIPQVSTYTFSAQVLCQSFWMRPFSRIIERAVINANNSCNEVIIPSKRLMDELRTIGLTANCTPVPLPLDFKPDRDVNRVRSDMPFTMLYVGRLATEKNITLLIRAFSLFVEKMVQAQLIIVGTGPEQEKLESLAKEVGVFSQVTFTGFVPHAQLPKYYRRAHVFVLPSVDEAFSLVVHEAMLFGLPVIMTRATPVAGDAITEGVNGFIVDHQDPTQLAERLGQLAHDKVLRQKMGEVNIQKVSEYTLPHFVATILSVYYRLLKQ